MPGDNFSVRVVSEGKAHFESAVRMAFSNGPGGKATHYLSRIPERRCSLCAGGTKEVVLAGQQDITLWRDKKRVRIDCEECGGKGKLPAITGMILYWTKPEDHTTALPLPFPLTVDAAVSFLWDWLQTADYGAQPDHDGDNGKGFIVTTGDFWGHCAGSHYSIVMIQPGWQMYGK